MSMTTELELAQRMKAAALKLDGEQWQTRDGFSGIEVVVKGSVAKGRGCVSYQPVAAELADSKTAKAIALFSPANIKALVEALEKTQTERDEFRHRLKLERSCLEDADKRNAELVEALEARDKQIAELTEARDLFNSKMMGFAYRVEELEARTVKLPEYRNSPDMHTKQFYEAIGFNEGLDAFISALRAAGVAVEGE